jgi:hypothetical protein
MSYDLYFTSPRITHSQFHAFFTARQHYQLSESRACYQNENTGVYFMINLNEDTEDDPEAVQSTASLNLNYYRPHVFGLEAVDEIQAFVEHFGFSIYDPQSEGVGDGPFSKEGFLKGWNHGNEIGYSAILNSENAPRQVFSYSSDGLESIWRWNMKKRSNQEFLSEDRFVPCIFFMEIGGRASSVAVWPDAISELIPHVDFLLIGRDELAPKFLFGGRKKDQIIVPMAALASDLAAYASDDYPMPAYLLPARRVPDSLRGRIRKLKATGIVGEAIPMDKVLNEELVRKHKKD